MCISKCYEKLQQHARTHHCPALTLLCANTMNRYRLDRMVTGQQVSQVADKQPEEGGDGRGGRDALGALYIGP